MGYCTKELELGHVVGIGHPLKGFESRCASGMFTGEAVCRKSICEIGAWGHLGGYRHSVLTDSKGQLGQSQWDGDQEGYQAVT